MNGTTEPLAPLTDARVRELSNLARCGPDVVAMAQEVARSRERIAALEAENAKGLANFDRMCLEAIATEKRLIMDLQYVRLVSVTQHDALCAIALALGLPADAAPDAVLAAVKAAAKDAARIGIYGASKTKHAALWIAARESGHPIISTWIDEAGEGETKDHAELAARCLREATSAKAVVLYCEPGDKLKGALIEIGAALSAGVPVYCVGTCDGVRSGIFLSHPLWHSADTIEFAIADALKGGHQ